VNALWDVLKSWDRNGSADTNIKSPKPRRPGLKYFSLPSPSRANTWKSFDEKLIEWRLISEVFEIASIV